MDTIGAGRHFPQTSLELFQSRAAHTHVHKHLVRSHLPQLPSRRPLTACVWCWHRPEALMKRHSANVKRSAKPSRGVASPKKMGAAKRRTTGKQPAKSQRNAAKETDDQSAIDDGASDSQLDHDVPDPTEKQAAKCECCKGLQSDRTWGIMHNVNQTSFPP